MNCICCLGVNSKITGCLCPMKYMLRKLFNRKKIQCTCNNKKVLDNEDWKNDAFFEKNTCNFISPLRWYILETSWYSMMNRVIGILPSKPWTHLTMTARSSSGCRTTDVITGAWGTSEIKYLYKLWEMLRI